MIIFRSFTFIILVSSLSGQKEIDFKNLKKIDNLFFIEGENIPADGSVYHYRNGEKEIMGIMKSGKKVRGVVTVVELMKLNGKSRFNFPVESMLSI